MRAVIYQEQEAFSALTAGDEKGFDFFFHLYYTPLVLYATKITGNYEAARDITSESFIKLWESKTSVTSCRNIKFFLYRVTYNASVDCLRKKKTGSRAVSTMATGTAPFENTILENLIEIETYQRLHTLLSRLPAGCRQVFQMFYFQDKAIKEIAEELGISVNTVKSQKLRAVQLLKHAGSLVNAIIVFLAFGFHF